MAGTKDFWSRIRPLLKMFQPKRQISPQLPLPSRQPVVPQPTQDTLGKLSNAQKVTIIINAGKQLLMLDMLYHGIWRRVEGYSFRDKGGSRLFYGFDHKDSHIKSFKLEEIESISISNDKYMPKWPVEL